MDRDKVNRWLAAVIDVLDEIGEAPEGAIYAGLTEDGMTINEWEIVKGILLHGRLARNASQNVLVLTEAGKVMAERIREFQRERNELYRNASR